LGIDIPAFHMISADICIPGAIASRSRSSGSQVGLLFGPASEKVGFEAFVVSLLPVKELLRIYE
jgi:hypothetical protein